MSHRISKLVAVKQRVVDAAARALSDAEARTRLAENVLAGTEATLADAAELSSRAATFADLADADARRATLRKAVDRARLQVALKRDEESRARAALAEARTEVRRFETWGERVAEIEAANAARILRSAEDARAARTPRDDS